MCVCVCVKSWGSCALAMPARSMRPKGPKGAWRPVFRLQAPGKRWQGPRKGDERLGLRMVTGGLL